MNITGITSLFFDPESSGSCHSGTARESSNVCVPSLCPEIVGRHSVGCVVEQSSFFLQERMNTCR